jgi:hypothetical protein
MKPSDPRVAAAVWNAERHRVLTHLVAYATGLLGTGIICLYLYLFP